MKITTVKQMQAIDRTAVDKFGIPEILLMENAGLAVTRVIADNFSINDNSFLVLCGTGNNGGDGCVVARQLHSRGAQVRVATTANLSHYSGIARNNLEILKALNIGIDILDESTDFFTFMVPYTVIVDAVFGTGITRPVTGHYANLIEAVNMSGKTVVSVDIPSGINGDNGQIMNIAVQADFTVTFGTPKLGNLLYPGYAHCGRLYVSRISFPPELYHQKEITIEITPFIKLPERSPAGHKGSFGDTLFIAGAASYYGAPYFAANSFLKAGGGYSRLAAPEGVVKTIAADGSEIVFHPQQETAGGSLAYANLDQLNEIAARTDFVVIGPGISMDKETARLVQTLVSDIAVPVLIDGDGLTSVARQLELIRRRTAPTILTPHLGEMVRLVGLTPAEIQADPVNILQKLSADLRAIIVLKGAHTLIGFPDGRVFLNPTGNSGMATAGSGDVLTGTIAAAYGIGLELAEAVLKGVFLHGLAGDLAAEEVGADGITATDIMNFLPAAIRQDRVGLPQNYLDQKYPVLI